MADGGVSIDGPSVLRSLLGQVDCTGVRSRTVEGAEKEVQERETPLGVTKAMSVPRSAVAYPGLLVVTDQRVYYVSGDRKPKVDSVALESIESVQADDLTFELHAAETYWRFDAGSFAMIADLIQQHASSASVEIEVPAEELNVVADLRLLAEDVGTESRWQYAVVNVGVFNSPARMASVLAAAGSSGWELVAVMDKASNWFAGYEKGFILLKRPVGSGAEPAKWCLTIRS